jgi:murein DD-endopeptidase MepM/ murein hydrolase activator NlpD
MKNGYLIKIVPPFGYRVFRLEFSRRHIVFLAIALSALVAGFGAYYFWTINHAERRVNELRALTEDQRSRLRTIDSQAAELDEELRSMEKQNAEIRRMIGERGGDTARDAQPKADTSKLGPTSMRESDFDLVAERVERLRRDSLRMRGDSGRIRSSALHVLNMARLEDLARARVLASIPSINPAGEGVGIRSSFGWRVDPWPEFHRGVDLAADYGQNVRAAAAGTVVFAAYDGGYGNRVDIDHGNGYHTWYCHLERLDVHPGQYVTKAQHIALVGSTGESTGPHLHYQVMLDNEAIDPAPYLRGVPANVLASLK